MSLWSYVSLTDMAMRFIPFVLFFELPIYVLIAAGVVRYVVRRTWLVNSARHTPAVSAIVTAYSEGEAVRMTIRSLAYQIYDGHIEILVMVDGAERNRSTLEHAEALCSEVAALQNRHLRVVPKWQRGGRVSSLNTGLALATGEIVMALDADTSFDNDMVACATQHFYDPRVVSVAGNLRVRNGAKSLIAALQRAEYMLSISLAKTGLSQFNILNNVSGAFGIFRASFLRQIGGWNTGTAEDLDLTLRMKQYFGRHKELRIRFEPRAIGHTDAPATLRGLLDQRLRWDGDLFYQYIRAHGRAFSPKVVGTLNFWTMIWTGLIWQIAFPALIFLSTIVLLITNPLALVGGLTILYVYYVVNAGLFYTLYIACLSERRVADLEIIPVLLLLPIYAFFSRLWALVAVMSSALFNGQLDSNMAPWWVLRKARY